MSAALRMDDMTDAREQILERLSHELRTPLNSVIGFSRVLQGNRTGNQRPSDLAMLEAIRANGERLLVLVEDLVALSVTPPVSAVPFAPLVCAADVAEDVVELWRAAAERKQISLTLETEAGGTVCADPISLAKLLGKLVSNAVKFTEHGGVVVKVTSVSGGNTPRSIVIMDSGIGIPPEKLSSIFEAFTQVDGTVSRRFEGAGLGLPIARALAKGMGCSLEVESEPGCGTRFELVFPR